jgi:N-dimethylarginine dimethylaminohydrolase
VLLVWPGEELARADPPDRYLMLEPVAVPVIQRQFERIAHAYAESGVEVRVYRPTRRTPPNLIFLRDLFFMTPEGAIIGRMASEQRAGEERFAAEALAEVGVPVLATVHGQGCFEGADAIWLDPRCVLLGIGRRTNRAGAEMVASVLRDLGVTTRLTELPDDTQHLVGVVNCLDARFAAIDADRATPTLRAILREHGYRLLELASDEELTRRRGMNFVAVGPSAVLMPSCCPGIDRRLEMEGISARCVDVGEYLKAAGGLACLTGILSRDPVAAPDGMQNR